MDPEHAIVKLERLARIRQQRQQDLEEAETALYAAVVHCDELGVARAKIASSAGLSRQTVYTVLERAAAG